MQKRRLDTHRISRPVFLTIKNKKTDIAMDFALELSDEIMNQSNYFTDRPGSMIEESHILFFESFAERNERDLAAISTGTRRRAQKIDADTTYKAECLQYNC